MPLSFPSSPTAGQTYAYGGRTWVYQDGGWVGTRSIDTSTSIGTLNVTAGEAITDRRAVRINPSTGLLTQLGGGQTQVLVGAAMPYPGHNSYTSGQYNGNDAVQDMFCAMDGGGSNVLISLFDKSTANTERITASIANSGGTGYLSGTHLGGDYWAVCVLQSTSQLRGWLLQYNPTTKTLTQVGTVVNQAVSTVTSGTACFSYTNPTTGVAFVGVDTGLGYTLYQLTRSGTTLVFTLIGSIQIGMNVGAVAIAKHAGVFTTVVLLRTSAGNHIGSITVDTSNMRIGSNYSQGLPVHTSPAQLHACFNGNNFLAIGCNTGVGTATNYQAGLVYGSVDRSGGFSFRHVPNTEFIVPFPYASNNQVDISGLVCWPDLNNSRAFYFQYRNGSSGYANIQRAVFNEDGTLNTVAPTTNVLTSFSSGQVFGFARNSFWTGRELHTSFNGASGGPVLFRPASSGSNPVIGISGNSASQGGSVSVYTAGSTVDGFTGLVAGSTYYAEANGSLTTADLGANAKVGVAVSSTRLAVTL